MNNEISNVTMPEYLVAWLDQDLNIVQRDECDKFEAQLHLANHYRQVYLNEDYPLSMAVYNTKTNEMVDPRSDEGRDLLMEAVDEIDDIEGGADG